MDTHTDDTAAKLRLMKHADELLMALKRSTLILSGACAWITDPVARDIAERAAKAANAAIARAEGRS